MSETRDYQYKKKTHIKLAWKFNINTRNRAFRVSQSWKVSLFPVFRFLASLHRTCMIIYIVRKVLKISSYSRFSEAVNVNGDFSSKFPIYTIKSLFQIHFTSTIFSTIFAAECLKIKLLIDICIVLCSFQFKNKCTVMHILSIRFKRRSLFRIDIAREQVG